MQMVEFAAPSRALGSDRYTGVVVLADVGGKSGTGLEARSGRRVGYGCVSRLTPRGDERASFRTSGGVDLSREATTVGPASSIFGPLSSASCVSNVLCGAHPVCRSDRGVGAADGNPRAFSADPRRSVALATGAPKERLSGEVDPMSTSGMVIDVPHERVAASGWQWAGYPCGRPSRVLAATGYAWHERPLWERLGEHPAPIGNFRLKSDY